MFFLKLLLLNCMLIWFVTLIPSRDIQRILKASRSLGSCCCSRVGTRAKLKCNGFVWKEGEERARASRPVPRGHDGYVFSPPLSTLHSPLWHHSLLSDLLVIWKQCGITWRNKATDWGTRFCWIMRVSRGEISRLGVLGVVSRENWLTHCGCFSLTDGAASNNRRREGGWDGRAARFAMCRVNRHVWGGAQLGVTLATIRVSAANVLCDDKLIIFALVRWLSLSAFRALSLCRSILSLCFFSALM